MNRKFPTRFRLLFFATRIFLLSFLLAATALAQPARPGQPAPDHADVPYDDHDPAQVLDVYLAQSADGPAPVMVYIHGGGWRAGSKKRLPAFLAFALTRGRISVVSVEYRFTDVAPHPAQTDDCIRAIQFIRSKAKEWNIDPERLGVTGGSAGGHLSLWVALHDDMADPDSKDPVERESSRVSCAISFAGPTDWKLLHTIEHRHPAYRQLLGYEPGTPAGEMSADAVTDVSPISFASKDDPPVLLFHGDEDTTVPLAHAEKLDTRMEKVGGRSELVVIEGGVHNVAGGAGKGVPERALAFAREHLLPAKDGK